MPLGMGDFEEVDPVNTKKQDGTVYTDEYDFGEVAIEDIPGDFNQKGVDFTHHDDHIVWHYVGKAPVMIYEDRVEAPKKSSKTEKQNQAFFALSILADAGYVSRWRKV